MGISTNWQGLCNCLMLVTYNCLANINDLVPSNPYIATFRILAYSPWSGSSSNKVLSNVIDQLLSCGSFYEVSWHITGAEELVPYYNVESILLSLALYSNIYNLYRNSDTTVHLYIYYAKLTLEPLGIGSVKVLLDIPVVSLRRVLSVSGPGLSTVVEA